MGKVNIKQLNVAPASGYVIGSGAGGVPVWKLEVTSVAWNQITGNQALVNLSGFTNDSGFITLGSLSAGTGISYNNLTGVVTNSAPDQTVVLTQGTGITITGTYPNFTIASNGNQTITLSGDVTGSGTTGIVTTIANNVVSDAKIGLRTALSVMGRETNSIGNVADILFSTSNGVLHRSGSTLATGLLTGSSISATNNQIFYGAGSLATQSANLTFDGTILSATSIINATIGFRVASAATTGNYLRGNGTNFISSALTASDLAANSITDGLIRQSAGLSVIGRSANSTGNVADITAGTDLHVLRRSGTSIGFGLLTLGSITTTSTQVPFGSTSNVLTSSSQFLYLGATPNRVRTVWDSSPTGRFEAGIGTDYFGLSNQPIFVGFSSLGDGINGLQSYAVKHGGSATAPTDYTGGNSSELYAIGGFVHLSSNPRVAAAMNFVGDGTASATSYSGRITFSTSNGAGTYAERMRINKDGQVGIGRTTMTSLLDVAGDIEIDVNGAFYLGDPTTDGTWRIIRSGNNLLSQRRESGSYVTKQTITP